MNCFSKFIFASDGKDTQEEENCKFCNICKHMGGGPDGGAGCFRNILNNAKWPGWPQDIVHINLPAQHNFSW